MNSEGPQTGSLKYRAQKTGIQASICVRRLNTQWAAGQRNGTELWRQLKGQGFRGCLRVVTEWATRRRKAEKVDGSALSRAPSARTIARLMTIGRDDLSESGAPQGLLHGRR
jgi:hypothetical protein